MNELDKKRLMNSYRDIRFAALKLFHSIKLGEDDCNICMSMYVYIRETKNFIENASDLFEDSAVSECSDYKRFYVNLRERVQDLRDHVKETATGNSVVMEGIEWLRAVVLRDEALFGYSDEEAKPVSGSYFTQYDFTLPVSLGRMNNDM